MAAAPLLVAAAALHATTAFTALLAAALLSDAIDGPIARARGQQSVRGAALDSLADAALYVAAPAGLLLLNPWLLADEQLLVVAVVMAYACPITFGAVRYRRLTSYHTIAARTSASCLAAAALAFLATGVLWPLRVAVALLVVSAAEEMAITMALSHWHANVPSLAAARQLRRESQGRLKQPAPGDVECPEPHTRGNREQT